MDIHLERPLVFTIVQLAERQWAEMDCESPFHHVCTIECQPRALHIAFRQGQIHLAREMGTAIPMSSG